MSKVIHLAGFKGGTGKTTLAIALANFIHYKMKLKVLLVGFDVFKEIGLLNKSAAYEIYEFKPATVIEYKTLIGNKADFDFIIVDFPGGINFSFLELHQFADKIIIPTDLSNIDLLKSIAFWKALIEKPAIKNNKIHILPNLRISNQNYLMVEDMNQMLKREGNLNILPPIPFSKCFQNFTFDVFKNKSFYLCRAAFSILLK